MVALRDPPIRKKEIIEGSHPHDQRVPWTLDSGPLRQVPRGGSRLDLECQHAVGLEGPQVRAQETVRTVQSEVYLLGRGDVAFEGEVDRVRLAAGIHNHPGDAVKGRWGVPVPLRGDVVNSF